MYAQIVTALQEEIAIFLDLTPAEIEPQQPLAELGIDSLQTLQLLVLLERQFGIQMDESDLQHFGSVHSIASLGVERLQIAQAPAPDFSAVLSPTLVPAIN